MHLPDRSGSAPRPANGINNGVARGVALLLFVALACSASCAQAVDLHRLWSNVAPTAGSGNAVTESRTVEDFTRLDLETGARVEIRQGNQAEVRVHADDNVQRLIDATVENGTLRIADSRHFKSTIARVVITVTHLERLRADGAVVVNCEPIAVPALSVDASGSSVVRLASIRTEQLDLAMNGSTVIRVNGTATRLSASMGGSSVLEASGLVSGAVVMTNGGSSYAAVGKSGALSLRLGGSSSVGYYGEPVLSVSSGGSASVRSLGSVPKT